MRRYAATAALASAATLGLVRLLGGAAAEPAMKIVLENDRVRVTERVVAPGVERAPFVRPTDQLIVFLNDTRYERIDADSGERVVRDRSAGEVIWHDEGEHAPRLKNVHRDAFRSLVIELKR